MNITDLEFNIDPLVGPIPIPWSGNCVLPNISQVEIALGIVRDLQLEPHNDPPKNWDSLIALSSILNSLDVRDRILDAGAETYSKILPWLSRYGFTDLYAINTAFEHCFISGCVLYERGDIESTRFGDGYFDAVTCLSVLEHGVNLSRYLTEASRILKPGGLLITSVDYWQAPIDCGGKSFYGMPVKIFSKAEILQFVSLAHDIGFTITSPLNLECQEKAVHWRAVDLHFTFLIMTMQKR
jgi:SAM-dependent methyltransferase